MNNTEPQPAYWCNRCLAKTEQEAEDICDGSGFEDDDKPECRSWCCPED